MCRRLLHQHVAAGSDWTKCKMRRLVLLLRLTAAITLRLAPAGGRLRFHVAPMQCFTNTHLRHLLRQFSPAAVLWSEMEKVEDLLKSEAALERRLRGSDEQSPVVLQLGGSDPEALHLAARRALPYGFDEVNLNCGCPTTQSNGKAGYGAELMRDPELTRQCVEALADACGGRVPVSVKCRINAHAGLSDGQMPTDDYDTLSTFVSHACEAAGASHVVLHARSAILSLSPLKNRQVPPLRHEWAHRLASDFPHLRITLNGGIASEADLHNAAVGATASGLDGLMSGRWVLRDPFALAGVERLLTDVGSYQSEDVPSPAFGLSRDVAQTAVAALSEYGRYASPLISGQDYARMELVPPLILVLEALRERIEAAQLAGVPLDAGVDAVLDALWEAICSVLWPNVPGLAMSGSRPTVKKMYKMLGQVTGRKVAKKAVRNRAEAIGTKIPG